ncbi:MAG: AAA family ATPase [Chromatiales bacterium]|nr:AAA family ATPase [Chromatiales bacterium]
MYLEHFQLKELPFRLSPDPAFLYLSQIHSRAKAYMESTIWFTDGFVVITGEIGSGKTTLIETFLKELEQDVVVAQINQTQISPIEFLQALLAQFGFSPFKMRKAELLATLNQFLDRAVRERPQGAADHRRGAEPQQQGARGSAPAVRRGDHQGEGAAHHPRRPAGAERQARLAGAGAAQAARAPALPPHRARASRTPAEYVRHRLRGGRRRRPRDLRARHVPADLPLHRRHPAPHQHAVRHGAARRVRAGPPDGRRRRRAARRSPSCSGSSTPARTSHAAAGATLDDTAPQEHPPVGRLVLSLKGAHGDRGATSCRAAA